MMRDCSDAAVDLQLEVRRRLRSRPCTFPSRCRARWQRSRLVCSSVRSLSVRPRRFTHPPCSRIQWAKESVSERRQARHRSRPDTSHSSGRRQSAAHVTRRPGPPSSTCSCAGTSSSGELTPEDSGDVIHAQLCQAREQLRGPKCSRTSQGESVSAAIERLMRGQRPRWTAPAR